MFTHFLGGEDIDVLKHWGRMSSVDPAQREDIKALIKGLKIANLWDKIAVINVVHDNAADSLLNLKGNSSGAPDSVQNGGSFTTDRGFTLSYTSNQRIQLPVTENTADLVSLFSAHSMVYIRSISAVGGASNGNYLFSMGTTLYSPRRDNSGLGLIRVAGPTDTARITMQIVDSPPTGTLTNNACLGCHIQSVSASNSRTQVLNDTNQTSAATESYNSLDAVNQMRVGQRADGSTTTGGVSGQYAAWGYGDEMTLAQMQTYEDLIRAYMQARGADVY